jgi:hypothetical protein
VVGVNLPKADLAGGAVFLFVLDYGILIEPKEQVSFGSKGESRYESGLGVDSGRNLLEASPGLLEKRKRAKEKILHWCALLGESLVGCYFLILLVPYLFLLLPTTVRCRLEEAVAWGGRGRWRLALAAPAFLAWPAAWLAEAFAAGTLAVWTFAVALR